MTYDASSSARPTTTRRTGAVKGKVEILRDRAGVPHIYAGRTDDLFFGLGLVVAEDRLWQMDRLRRRALGRQAEILGEAYLNYDIAHRTLGLDRIAIDETSKLDGKTYEECAAYVAGINRQIEIFGKKLPPEFKQLGYEPEAFKVSDLVAIARGFWWSLNGRIDRLTAAEAAKLLPEQFREIYLTPEAAEHVVLPDGGSLMAGSDDQTGSNNWASSGRITKGGKAVLAGDPHQPFWVPSSWYEYGVHGPEDDAAGAGHPGFPGLWWGSNGTVAWAITNNMASTRDLYREEVDAKSGRYLDGDTLRDFETRTETIQVKGGKARKITVRSTVRGPVVNDLVTLVDDPKKHAPISLRWSSLEHLDDLRASINLSRVKNFKEFRNNLRDWAGTVFNFVYADSKGNVGYQMAGRVPLRGRVTYGLRDANNPQDRWKGHIPFEKLPYSYNPKRGYVASANQRIVPPNYPEVIYGAYSQAHRGIRINQAFAEGGWDTKATVKLQNDVKSVRSERVVPAILKVLAGSKDKDAKDVAAALKGWDYEYTLQTVAATVFETFMFHWQRRVVAEYMPERLLDLTMQQTNLACHLLAKPSTAYFKKSSVAAEAEKSAKQAIATLTKRLGSDRKKWNWGAIHVAHWKHPLSNASNAKDFDIGPRAADGGSHTVRNMGGELPPHAASSGAEYRIVVDFAKPGSFRAVQNIGNSGVPGNPHYRDQFDDFIDGRYHTVHLKRSAVEADLESTTEIAPK